MKKLCLALATLTATASAASAAHIDGAAAGIGAPTITIGFDEVGLPNGAVVTDQFAGLGVTFAPGLTYLNSVSPRPNFSGPALLDFNTAPNQGTPFSIFFPRAVTAASAAVTANNGSATFTSLLGGDVVESFVSPLDLSADNFFGFEDSLFDTVVVTPSGSNSIALDNLSYTLSAVPVPASLPLLGLALAALGWRGSRKRR